MALPTFPLTTPLTDSEQDATEVRTLAAEFGDDYSQESIDGRNPLRYRGGWTFQGTHAEIAAAVTFLETNCVSGFLFTPPHLSSPRQYRCTEWQDRYLTGDDATITCRFRSFSTP